MTHYFCAHCRCEMLETTAVCDFAGRPKWCSDDCHRKGYAVTRAKFEADRARRREAAEAECARPSYPPKAPLSSYPKRGPNGLLAVTTDLGEGMARVVCGSHSWTEVTEGLPTEFGFVEEAVQRAANEFSLCFVNPARASLSRASRTVRGLRSSRPDFNPLH